MPVVLQEIARNVGDLARCGPCDGWWVLPGDDHTHGKRRTRLSIAEGVWVRDGASKSPNVKMGEEYRFGQGDFIVVLDQANEEIENFPNLFARIDRLSEGARREMVECLVSNVYCDVPIRAESVSEEARPIAYAALSLAVIEDRNYPGYWELGGGFYLPVRAFIAVADGVEVNGQTLRSWRALAHLNDLDPLGEGQCPLCGEEHAIPRSARILL